MIPTCKYRSCPDLARGASLGQYCNTHRLRARRGHPPMDHKKHGPGAKRPLVVRLSENIAQGNPEDEACWDWLMYKERKGYGIIAVDRVASKVHRVLYELLIGPIPAELELCHFLGCKCVNPWHCLPGTSLQNQAQGRVHKAATRAGHPLFTDPYEEVA